MWVVDMQRTSVAILVDICARAITGGWGLAAYLIKETNHSPVRHLFSVLDYKLDLV